MTDLDYSLEFYSDASGEWRWRLKHSNSQIVAASSEGFSSQDEARANAKRTRDALHLVLYAEPAS